MKDERRREETDKKKLDLNLRKSSAEDKLLLSAQLSMQNGITYDKIKEFPHRKHTYHSRLMMPLPMSSTDIWIARSYMDNTAEPFMPRTNFQFDLFGPDNLDVRESTWPKIFDFTATDLKLKDILKNPAQVLKYFLKCSILSC